METAFQKLQQSYWKFSKKEWRAGKTKNLTTYLKILRASVVVEGGGNKVKILQGGYKNSCNESPHTTLLDKMSVCITDCEVTQYYVYCV